MSFELPKIPDFEPFFDSAWTPPGDALPSIMVDEKDKEHRIPVGLRRYRLIDADTYHGLRHCLSSSVVKKGSTPASLLHALMQGGGDPAAEDKNDRESGLEGKTLGTLIHWACLEPEMIDNIRDYVVKSPTIGLATDKAAECRRDNPGKLVVSGAHIDQARACCEAIRAHPLAQKYLSEGSLRECSGFYRFGDSAKVWCKWRPDFMPLDNSFIGDVKSTKVDLSEDNYVLSWVRECFNMGYFHQAAWYLTMHELLTGIRVPKWVWIITSTAPSTKRGLPHAAVITCTFLQKGEPKYDKSKGAIVMPRMGLEPDSVGTIQKFISCAQETIAHLRAGKTIETLAMLRKFWPCREYDEPEDIGIYDA